MGEKGEAITREEGSNEERRGEATALSAVLVVYGQACARFGPFC